MIVKRMIRQLIQEQKSLYDSDYNLWVLETVKKLENRDLNSLDWENLIQEVLLFYWTYNYCNSILSKIQIVKG